MVDAAINLILGGMLLFFPKRVIGFLGAPMTQQPFYPSILGGVLIGIGIALIIECVRKGVGPVGLGLGGAVAVNLSAGFVLAAWLLFSDLGIPLKGQIFLWGLVLVLVVISVSELVVYAKETKPPFVCARIAQ